MKKISLIISLIISCNFVFGQLVISNGEDIGLDWWQAGSTAVEVVDWHPKDGNPSDKAMTIWISTNSDQWSGGGLSGLNIDVSDYSTISLLIYKNVSGTVQLELQDGVSNYFLIADYTTAGEWQKIDFTIPSGMGNITTLLIAPFIDYDLSTIVGEQSRCFWDEITIYNKITTNQTHSLTAQDNIYKTIVYSLNGHKVDEFVNFNNILEPGLYIIEKRYASGIIAVEKKAILKR